MLRKRAFPIILLVSLAVLVAACSSTPAAEPTKAPAAPTTAPAKAAPTQLPAPEATKVTAAKTEVPAVPAVTTPASARTDATPQAAGPKPQLTSGWPSKTVTFLIPYNAGGSSDAGARIVGGILEKEFGKSFQVENKPGAGGQVGWTDLAQSKADGYVIGGINLPHLPAVVVDPSRQAAFKQDDIIPLASQAVDPTVVSVSSKSKWKTLKDLVDDAKTRPGEISAGIVGILNDDEIGYLQFADAAGVELRPVRFDGAAPAMTALLGDHVDVLFSTVGDNYGQFKSDNVRILGVMSEERVKQFYPDAPTLKELGYGEIYSSSTRGFAVPKGVPEPVMKDIEAALLYAMRQPEHIQKMEEAGQPAVILGREEFTKLYNTSFQQVQKWIDRRIKD